MRQRQPHHPHGLNEIALERAAPLLVGAVGNARPTGFFGELEKFRALERIALTK
jgi:hypothetical protein